VTVAAMPRVRSGLVAADGTVEWRDGDGGLHRAGGPARECADGSREWWLHGRRHRDDGPAVERCCPPWRFGAGGRPERVAGPPSLRLEWWAHGVRHRDDGPAVVDGATREFYRAGALHRDRGPAVVHPDGTREYYRAGERHRADGPAVEHADGAREWWLRGQRWEPVPGSG
jgi:hypothetical protein